jgi:hypothetical protein
LVYVNRGIVGDMNDSQIDRQVGFDAGYYDARHGDRHRAEENERLFEAESASYREGYEAGWENGQPDIDTGRIEP